MADGGDVCKADTEYHEINSIHVVLGHHRCLYKTGHIFKVMVSYLQWVLTILLIYSFVSTMTVKPLSDA